MANSPPRGEDSRSSLSTEGLYFEKINCGNDSGDKELPMIFKCETGENGYCKASVRSTSSSLRMVGSSAQLVVVKGCCKRGKRKRRETLHPEKTSEGGEGSQAQVL